MINLSPTPPPAHLDTNLDRLFALIHFISDHKACAARLGDLMKETGDAAEVIHNAEKVKSEIAAERDKQAKEIEAERKAFVAQCNKRDNEINDRRAGTEKLNREAQAARDEADRVRDDLKLRLERVKSAAV